LNALITLIGFTGLTDAPDSQLSSKVVGGTQFAIYQFLQRKFVGCLLSKGDLSHVVSSLIKGMHGLKQGLMLFFSWSKLQEHRLFHASNVAPLIEVVNSLSPRRALPPRSKETGLPRPI
jgi:hypothetical protein